MIACSNEHEIVVEREGDEISMINHGKWGVIQKGPGVDANEFFFCRDKRGIAIVSASYSLIRYIVECPANLIYRQMLSIRGNRSKMTLTEVR